MKLGIYGDSYGNLNLEKERRQGLGTCWIEELQKLTGYTEVSNYAAPGVSLMYCYEQYKKTKTENNFNIFIIPNLARSYYPELEKLGLGNSWYANYQSILVAQQDFELMRFDDDNVRNKMKRILDSVLTYHELWRSSSYDTILNKSFALNLIQSEQNTLFLYTDLSLFGPDRFTLVNLSQWEMNELGWKALFTEKDIHYGTVQNNKFLADARLCHLSQENNIILAQKIKDAIDQQQKVLHLNKDDYQVPPNHITHYIRWENLNKGL